MVQTGISEDRGASWYSVRCFLEHEAEPGASYHLYEERITLWFAESADAAIEQAEIEAQEYGAYMGGGLYLGLAQSYELIDDIEPEQFSGTEVFSLMRESDLDPDQFLLVFSRGVCAVDATGT